jgi:hypothetical protein
MGFRFIRLFSECSRAEDHPGDRQARLTEFRELHWHSLEETGVFRLTKINDDDYH